MRRGSLSCMAMVLIAVCSTVADEIDNRMRLAPLSSISPCYKQLGIDRHALVAATEAIAPKSELRLRRRDEPIWEPIVRKTANWKECQDQVDKLLGLDETQKTKHRAIVFQTLLAKEWVVGAARYAGLGLTADQEKEVGKKRDALRKKLREQRDRDLMAIHIHGVAREVGAEKLRRAIGKPYRFKAPTLVDDSAGALEDFIPSLQPLRMLRTPTTQTELKLRPAQVDAAKELEAKWLRVTGLKETEAFACCGIDYCWGDAAEENVYQHTTTILNESLELLDDEQGSRLCELLLRSYIHVNRLDLVAELLGEDASNLQSIKSQLRAEVKAAYQLRGVLTYLPLLEPYLTDDHRKKFMSFSYIPRTSKVKQFSAPLVKELRAKVQGKALRSSPK